MYFYVVDDWPFPNSAELTGTFDNGYGYDLGWFVSAEVFPHPVLAATEIPTPLPHFVLWRSNGWCFVADMLGPEEEALLRYDNCGDYDEEDEDEEDEEEPWLLIDLTQSHTPNPWIPPVSSVLAYYTWDRCKDRVSFCDRTYKRLVLESRPEYDVVLICWRANQTTPIHDHPEGGCWMHVLCGELEETEVAGEGLKTLGIRRHAAGACGFKQGSEVLHSIRAITDTVSLHVYVPGGFRATVYSPNKS